MSNTNTSQAFNAKKATYMLVAFFVVLHLSLANSFGLGVDEAHYGLYALNLDWSYFDHPPMVGWLLAVGRPFGLDSFVLRLIPTIIMALNSVLLFRLSSRLYNNDSVGLLAVALFHLGSITQLLGWGMVPDVPLITWNLLIANLVISLRQQFSWSLWLGFGVIVGLTGLTKYTAIAIPISIAIWLLRERQFMAWLKQPGLWVSIVIALIMILPVLLWNHWNQWISFEYQFNHGTHGEWLWKNVGRMLLVQFATYSPLLFCLCITYLFTCLRRNNTSGERYLLIAALVNLAIVGWSSGNGELLPHWAAIGWLLLTPLAAYQLTLAWKKLGGKIWTSVAGGFSVLLVGLVFVLITIKPVNIIPDSKNALMDLVGWDEAAARAAALATEHNSDYLWVSNWADASRIAWYAHPMKLQVADDKMNQFEVWNGYPQGSSTAILTLPKRIKDERTPQTMVTPVGGNQCHLIDELAYKVDSVEVNVFWFYLCKPV
ncbi:MAG: hypothetical protein COA99_09170 [Moraxellaceae bacterium]|nr:MAG: hypothetical protein COA99_09170 [Moraxellaceae bacterium]